MVLSLIMSVHLIIILLEDLACPFQVYGLLIISPLNN